MASILDDSKTISIGLTTQGHAVLSNVSYPSTVDINTPFDLTYSVTNNGGADTIWGGLYDATGVLITGTFFSESFTINETKSKLIHFLGLTAPFTGQLRAGHVE